MKHDISEVLKRLFAFLEKFMEVTPDFREHITNNIKPFYFTEDKTIFEIGDNIIFTYFISDGYMTCSEFSKELGDQVVDIFSRDQIVAPPSFHNNLPATHDLKVLADTYVLFLTYDQMQEIYRKFPFTQELAKLILNYYKLLDQKRIGMLRQSGVKSVFDFYCNYPSLLVKSGAALKDQIIASYLLMNERTLRRNRRKLLSSKKLKYFK